MTISESVVYKIAATNGQYLRPRFSEATSEDVYSTLRQAAEYIGEEYNPEPFEDGRIACGTLLATPVCSVR